MSLVEHRESILIPQGHSVAIKAVRKGKTAPSANTADSIGGRGEKYLEDGLAPRIATYVNERNFGGNDSKIHLYE